MVADCMRDIVVELSFGMRCLLVQALYAFRASRIDDHGRSQFAGENGALRMCIGTVLDDVLCISCSYNECSVWCGHEAYIRDCAFTAKLLEVMFEVAQRQRSLDSLISGHLGDDWCWSRVNSVVKMILRLGAYEITALDAADEKSMMKSTVNGYLRVARTFGCYDDIGFVHAVLDKILNKFCV